MKIERGLYERILNAYPPAPPECGGILGSRDGVCISHHCFDLGSAETARAVYVPNVARLNEVISRWHDEGIRFMGLLHSHPPTCRSLSEADEAYIRTVLTLNEQEELTLFFPIILPHTELLPFVARKTARGITVCGDELQLIGR